MRLLRLHLTIPPPLPDTIGPITILGNGESDQSGKVTKRLVAGLNICMPPRPTRTSFSRASPPAASSGPLRCLTQRSGCGPLGCGACRCGPSTGLTSFPDVRILNDNKHAASPGATLQPGAGTGGGASGRHCWCELRRVPPARGAHLRAPAAAAQGLARRARAGAHTRSEPTHKCIHKQTR
eukprot:1187287-Prorocentrum_minimum.AAC.1